MYGIYGNIYHQYTPNVSIYTIHGSYGFVAQPMSHSLQSWFDRRVADSIQRTLLQHAELLCFSQTSGRGLNVHFQHDDFSNILTNYSYIYVIIYIYIPLSHRYSMDIHGTLGIYCILVRPRRGQTSHSPTFSRLCTEIRLVPWNADR